MPKLAPGMALLLFSLAALAAALLFWPRSGLIARLSRRFARSDGILGEDILKAVYHKRVTDLASAVAVLGVSRTRCERVIRHLVDWKQLTITTAGALVLSEAGRARAVQLVRAHRLWERYLADRTGLAEAEWHDNAERQEHLLSPAETDRLAARMGGPLLDPHGDPIPGPQGDVLAVDGIALSEARPGHHPLEIIHLEDEPTQTYRRLVDAGFAPGQAIEVQEADGDRVRVLLEGVSITIGRAEADSITVRGARGSVLPPHRALAALPEGASARVIGLAPTVHGPQRRRLLDLGFVPGTEVTAELRSSLGEPVAYRVRGALIALRREQAAAVLVESA